MRVAVEIEDDRGATACMHNEDNMTLEHKSTPFARRLFALVLPIAFQNLISSLVNMADVVMVGSVRQSALSAVALAGQVTFVLMLFYFGISSGVGILTAQYSGKGDLLAVERVLGIDCGFSAAVSALFFLAALFMPENLMRILTNNKELIELGASYLRILSVSYLFMSLSQIYLGMLRSMGRAKLSATISSISLMFDTAITAEQMNEIATIAHASGVMTYYHNHFHEFQTFNGKYVLDILMDNTDPALVGMQLDTYWAQRGGQDPVAWIRRLGSRCSMIHQKDLPKGVNPVNIFELLPENPVINMESFSQFSNVGFFTEVGMGMMDIPNIIKAAEDNNAKYIIVEQDLTALTELESIQVSYEVISGILGK